MMAAVSCTLLASANQRPLIWPAKDPDEVVAYGIDFTPRLDADLISSATFSLSTAAGLSIDSSDHVGPIASVTLSGGTEGEKGKILCRIVTADGQTFDETASLVVRSR